MRPSKSAIKCAREVWKGSAFCADNGDKDATKELNGLAKKFEAAYKPLIDSYAELVKAANKLDVGHGDGCFYLRGIQHQCTCGLNDLRNAIQKAKQVIKENK